jgi:hypothetical protein
MNFPGHPKKIATKNPAKKRDCTFRQQPENSRSENLCRIRQYAQGHIQKTKKGSGDQYDGSGQICVHFSSKNYPFQLGIYEFPKNSLFCRFQTAHRKLFTAGEKRTSSIGKRNKSFDVPDLKEQCESGSRTELLQGSRFQIASSGSFQ